jgi:hypothetical protein
MFKNQSIVGVLKFTTMENFHLLVNKNLQKFSNFTWFSHFPSITLLTLIKFIDYQNILHIVNTNQKSQTKRTKVQNKLCYISFYSHS